MKNKPVRLLATIALVSLLSPQMNSAPMVSIGDSVNVFFDGSFRGSYETNVFADVNDQDDFIFVFSPGVSIEAGRNSNASFNIVFREDIIRYSTFDGQDTENFNVISSGIYRNDKLDLKANASFQQVSSNTAARNVNVSGLIIDRDLYNAGVEGEYDFSPKTYMEAGAAYRLEEYTNNPGGFSDQDSFSFPVNVLYRYSEKLSVGLGYRYKMTDVEPNIVSRGNTYTDNFGSLALRYNSVKWNGRVNLGVQNRDSDIGTNNTSFTVNSDFGYKFSPKTSLRAGIDRDFDSGGDGRSIEDTRLSFGGTWNYNQLLALGADVGYTYSDYSGTTALASREDDRYTSSFNVAYSPSTYVTLGAGYSFDYNDSSNPLDDYENHSFNLSARLRY